MILQALVGELLDAKDIASDITAYCEQYPFGQPFNSCGVYTDNNNGFYAVGTGHSLRISWTCICGVGDAPTVDPITGACTQCPAGANAASRIGRLGGPGAGRGQVQEARDSKVLGLWRRVSRQATRSHAQLQGYDSARMHAAGRQRVCEFAGRACCAGLMAVLL